VTWRRSRNSSEDYKKRYNVDPNIGAVYGYVAADITVQGTEERRQGPELDSFVKGLERSRTTSIFNGPPVTFGPTSGRVQIPRPRRGQERPLDAR